MKDIRIKLNLDENDIGFLTNELNNIENEFLTGFINNILKKAAKKSAKLKEKAEYFSKINPFGENYITGDEEK